MAVSIYTPFAFSGLLLAVIGCSSGPRSDDDVRAAEGGNSAAGHAGNGGRAPHVGGSGAGKPNEQGDAGVGGTGGASPHQAGAGGTAAGAGGGAAGAGGEAQSGGSAGGGTGGHGPTGGTDTGGGGGAAGGAAGAGGKGQSGGSAGAGGGATCGGCTANDQCFPVGAVHPTDPCRSCESAPPGPGWSVRVGAPCDDGAFCTSDDSCNSAAECVGSGDTCAGGDTCNDACDEVNDNCFEAAGTSCDDGLFCTETDACDGAGTCVGTGSPCSADDACKGCNEAEKTCLAAAGTICDDGLFCTAIDECDGAGVCLGQGNPCEGGDVCNSECHEEYDNCWTRGRACVPETVPESSCNRHGEFEFYDGTGTCWAGSCGADSGFSGCLYGECNEDGCPHMLIPCNGGKFDPSTGLCWSKSAMIGLGGNRRTNVTEAEDSCEHLSSGGHTDWRLPTVDELRSLIVGCADTAPEGDCPVTHGFLAGGVQVCDGCRPPSPGRQTWMNEYFGDQTEEYWSSSPAEPPHVNWKVRFMDAQVRGFGGQTPAAEWAAIPDARVLCVRDEQCTEGYCPFDPECSRTDCNSPPPATCEGNVLRYPMREGECENGKCSYQFVELTCPVACHQDTCDAFPDCDGGKFDPVTNLCWQEPMLQAKLGWRDAADYCANLDLAGHDDWYLAGWPELETLVAGCPDGGCRSGEGPHRSGCYLEGAFQFDEDCTSGQKLFITTSVYSRFDFAKADKVSWLGMPPDDPARVRCVRKGL